MNQLFYCSLLEDRETESIVIVRIMNYEKLKDTMDFGHVLSISLLLSEKGIAPKILGNFQHGTINEFIKV